MLDVHAVPRGTGPPRSQRAATMLGALVAVALLAPSGASAASQAIYNWDMYTDTPNTYGGGFYPTSDYSNYIYYRWLDRPPTSSRISTNRCSNYSDYQYKDFGQDTDYRTIGFWTSQTCLVMRGRSLGTINFYNHDGNKLY